MKKAVKKVVRKGYRYAKKTFGEDRGGFKVIPQKDAYFFEDRITKEIKQHYCEQKSYAQLKYFPNLKKPTTYNEKIIWLALNYKNPIIAQCTDKHEFKQYAIEHVGADKVVPEIGVYTDVNDIDFDALPESFVVKSTAGWGNKQVIIVDSKKDISIDKLKSKIVQFLYPWNTYYYNNMCITDEKIVPRIIIEENICENGEVPNDCKIYCCNGIPKFALVVSGRNTKQQKRSFVNLDNWEVFPFKRKDINNSEQVEKPEYLEEMLEMSRRVSKDIPLVRVDFYLCSEKIYIGEMTFSPGMFLKIEPYEWDVKLGSLIELPVID